jgi:Kef-type K+ transport system membrane component KefB
MAIALGIRLAPAFVRVISWIQARGALIVSSVAFAVALAAVADLIGLATIVGAFAAGLVLATTDRRVHIDERIKPVSDLLAPVFFVTVGMKVDLSMLSPFSDRAQLGLTLALTAIAVAAKLTTGLAVHRPNVQRWLVAVGMVPRGEVGLIFAGTALATRLIAPDLYSVLVVVVMLTTLIAPPWLKALYRGR